MDVFWFWFLILMLVVLVFAWPSWPYTYERWPYRYGGGYRYAAPLVAAGLALLVLLLFWLGMLAIAWPWAAAPVAPPPT
ncbi:hypothetical protein [Rhodosalinus sp.]|uniref:hypothetical protein n=1 Tax=Rhodosalinus sp. TaxID=2047741 RepID=UPI00397B446E